MQASVIVMDPGRASSWAIVVAAAGAKPGLQLSMVAVVSEPVTTGGLVSFTVMV